jgi:hypothetical protein
MTKTYTVKMCERVIRDDYCFVFFTLSNQERWSTKTHL